MGNEATITIPLEKRNSVIGENKILKDNEKYNTAVITELEEEIKKLKSDLAFEKNMLDNVGAEYDNLQNVIKKLKAENKYLHNLLPEADGYIIEKQLEKRVRNDGEEDVY